ncbi:ferredoxin--NADP reductase [Proteobacteria bacterium 005FR1]|nr:ferredoxin--NADP reductase [Proteobacteria bacterium 005FR1]
MATSHYHSLEVAEIVDETADAKSIVFRPSADQSRRFQYQPGQFLTLRLPWQDGHLLRCYSMSSTPELDEGLRITVKRVKDGRGSNWICDNVQQGDIIEVLPPSGVFVPQSLDDNFLLFAGGSGITPVLSILRAALLKGKGRVRLIYANRDEHSIIFRELLKDLQSDYGERLDVIHLLDSVQGIPNAHLLQRLAEAMPDAQAFVCGPGPFMESVEAVLRDLGIPDERLHIERFISLPDEKALEEIARKREQQLNESVGASARVTVEIDGETLEFDCESTETVLEAAERAGHDLPYSCRAGMCASCMCEVAEGEIKLLHNEVLDQRDLNNGTTLTCQAVPVSKSVKLTFT